LSLVTISGEAAAKEHLEAFSKAAPTTRLINLYGSTEVLAPMITLSCSMLLDAANE
jgi:acyl-coenzyme A synthetase/AMP-(fatty) acid ligase